MVENKSLTYLIIRWTIVGINCCCRHSPSVTNVQNWRYNGKGVGFHTKNVLQLDSMPLGATDLPFADSID